MKFSIRQISLAVVVVASLLSSGCATITRGTTQPWTVDSSPTGAVASLSNGERCETPCTLTLKRKHAFAVEVCKAGYRTVNTAVMSGISGAGATGMAGNVLVGGLIGIGIDAATGATKNLSPSPLMIELAAETEGCTNPSFPAVPEGGQSVEEHQTQKDKKSKKSNKANKA